MASVTGPGPSVYTHVIVGCILESEANLQLALLIIIVQEKKKFCELERRECRDGVKSKETG